MGESAVGGKVELSGLSVRPVSCAEERARWDRLMDAHHYLGFRCLFGGGVRHVAEASDGRCAALGRGPAGAGRCAGTGRQVRPAEPDGRPDAARMMVAAVEHGSGMVLGQTASDSAGGGILKTGRTSVETVYGLTSLGPGRAGPSEILALNRGHWEIENRVHYVRDFAYDEDHSRVRAGRLPRNLACLSNAAISIVRMRGRFRYQPQAHRHYAARQA